MQAAILVAPNESTGGCMAQRTILAAVFALGMAVWSNAGRAEGALAIGLHNGDPHDGFVVGISRDKATPEAAREDAMSECRDNPIPKTARAKADCKIIEVFRNQCANDAINGNATDTVPTAVGWGVGPDSATADSRAVAMCELMRRGRGRPCRADGAPICDGDAK
jgi:hypothetical protein